MQLEGPENQVINYNREDENQLSLRNIFNILFRHKLKIILFFVVTVAVVTVFMLLKPDVYESQATLLVKAGREKISWDASMLGVAPSININSSEDLDAELIILTSGPVLAKVVDTIGPEELIVGTIEDEDNTPELLLEMAIESLMENLTLETEEGSTYINLGFQAPDPRLAQKVLENMIGFYMERRIEVFRNNEASRFLREQSEKALSRLEQREEEFKQFRNKQGIVSMEGQKESLVKQIDVLTRDMDDINLQISTVESNIILLEKGDSSALSDKVVDPVVVSIKQRLVDLKFDEAEFENRYPDDSRVLIDLRKRISFAEAELLKAQGGDAGLDTDTADQTIKLELEKSQAQIHVLVAQKQLLNKTLEERKAELVKLTNYETMFLSLERKVEIAGIEYSQYSDSYAKAKSSAALDADKVSNIVIVQPATLSTKPIDSKKKLGVALSIVLGLCGGVGMAFVLEFLDDTIKTSEDVVKQLKLPVLASINYKRDA